MFQFTEELRLVILLSSDGLLLKANGSRRFLKQVGCTSTKENIIFHILLKIPIYFVMRWGIICMNCFLRSNVYICGGIDYPS